MSANAAVLSCPICLHTGVFDSVKSLRDRLIYVSTNKLLCPVCQEEVFGLDKLTIHLFSHVELLAIKENLLKSETDNSNTNIQSDTQTKGATQQKKFRTSVFKNKTSSSTINAPVKYIKIYPKLPLISVNPVLMKDSSHDTVQECAVSGKSMLLSNIKPESSLPLNTTCNVCGLQFVDANILRMHRFLIHNIDENANQNFTRYQCHLCPKNFKMRGSLMVHLRVAHYGFSSNKESSCVSIDKEPDKKNQNQLPDDQPVAVDRNDNKQWQCDVCRKCFTTKYFLKKHKRLHTGETPYACTQCNKTFTFQQSYHKHLLYHNDEKPHTCSYCGRAFKELSTLHNHQRIHTGEKPFSCESCGKCFRQRVSYLVHRRIHTGAMPYKCTACDKSFRYKVSQRTHKCQAQPPGTVVRQSGNLVEKLKKKHTQTCVEDIKPEDSTCRSIEYSEVSEANAELVRTGAKLSLEDTETENFTLIAEAFKNDDTFNINSSMNKVISSTKKDEMPNTSIEELIDSIPVIDKNMPSPSEILKKLCLSKEEDYIGIRQEQQDGANFEISNDFDVFL